MTLPVVLLWIAFIGIGYAFARAAAAHALEFHQRSGRWPWGLHRWLWAALAFVSIGFVVFLMPLAEYTTPHVRRPLGTPSAD